MEAGVPEANPTPLPLPRILAMLSWEGHLFSPGTGEYSGTSILRDTASDLILYPQMERQNVPITLSNSCNLHPLMVYSLQMPLP